MQVLLIIALVFAIVVALFVGSNAVPVTVRFLGLHLETSLAIVALGSVAVGTFVMGLLGVVRQLRLGFRIRAEQAKSRRLEEELASVREELERLRRELPSSAEGEEGGS